ncbi:hypothetical protein ACHAXA_007741 [Cyclostephanos tholiformis]|uniref:HSF-type DNA-binding domain-containing protein n=1 Tax=Cyclostephanos tholiformis TaxID=382380 RepID=A0ABD3RYE5_9STRA
MRTPHEVLIGIPRNYGGGGSIARPRNGGETKIHLPAVVATLRTTCDLNTTSANAKTTTLLIPTSHHLPAHHHPARPPPLCGHPIPEFLCHLYSMLNDPSLSDIMLWEVPSVDESNIPGGGIVGIGKIVVLDPMRLQNEVLGKYYRHSQYSSFQRQLNYFGFKKKLHGSRKGKLGPCSYVHDSIGFELESLLGIKRRSATSASSSANDNGGNKVNVGKRRVSSSPGRPDPSGSGGGARMTVGAYPSSTSRLANIRSLTKCASHGTANRHTAAAAFSSGRTFLGLPPSSDTSPSVVSSGFRAPEDPSLKTTMITTTKTKLFNASVGNLSPPVATSDDGTLFPSPAASDNGTLTVTIGHPAEMTRNHSSKDFNDFLSHLLGTTLPPSDELFDDDMSAGNLSDFGVEMDEEGAASMIGGPLQVADDGMLLPY